MTIADIEQIIETWAPTWSAWEKDNVGLQLGDRSRKVSKILVALDVTESIIAEAIARKAELIVSHHPLLFRPLKAVTTSDETGKLVWQLAKANIAVYSAHTNLDFTKHGVSFALAKALGLKDIAFLAPLKGTLAKIAVFVPEPHVDRVANAMSDAGAGVIGEYDYCSFRVNGTGTFRGSSGANPFIGKPGKVETVDEVRLEMVVPRGNLKKIVAAMKKVHPYEEVAYDLYPLENENPNFGMGATGNLSRRMPLPEFLQHVKKSLGAKAVRYTTGAKRQVKKVAVCGGSGSELLTTAIRSGVDAFVTADVKYHTYHSATGSMTLIDAGHWETERVILEPLAERLRKAAHQQKERLTVRITKLSTNPIHYF